MGLDYTLRHIDQLSPNWKPLQQGKSSLVQMALCILPGQSQKTPGVLFQQDLYANLMDGNACNTALMGLFGRLCVEHQAHGLLGW